MNLAEFPVMVLSQSTKDGQNTIEYTDTITGKNDGKKERHWKVVGSDEWGLPTGSALRTLYELLNLWKEQGFESKDIRIGSMYRLLKRMGKGTSKRNYEQLKRDLNALIGVTIHAESAFWDSEAQAYVDQTFNLFQHWEHYDQRHLGNRTRQQMHHLDTIRASDIFYDAVRSGNVLTIDNRLFQELSSPTEQRLALYLTKMLKGQPVHRRDIFKLAEQLPLSGEYPSVIKRKLDKALDGLLEKGFSPLAKYYYEESADGESENIIFVGYKSREEASSDDEDKIEIIVDEILEVTQDEKSRAFYRKVADRCPYDLIRRALSETKQDYSDEEVQTSRGAIFTDKVKRYANRQGISLSN